MRQNLTERGLYWLVLKAPEKFKQRAYDRLARRRPSATEKKRWFGILAMNTPEPYRTMSWRKFLKLNPSNKEIKRVSFTTDSHEIKIEAWKKYLNKPLQLKI